MRRFLSVLAVSLLLVLAYAFFQRQRARPRVGTTAEDELALVCAAYDEARTWAQVDALPEPSRVLHQAADSLCAALATKVLRDSEQEVK